MDDSSKMWVWTPLESGCLYEKSSGFCAGFLGQGLFYQTGPKLSTMCASYTLVLLSCQYHYRCSILHYSCSSPTFLLYSSKETEMGLPSWSRKCVDTRTWITVTSTYNGTVYPSYVSTCFRSNPKGPSRHSCFYLAKVHSMWRTTYPAVITIPPSGVIGPRSFGLLTMSNHSGWGHRVPTYLRPRARAMRLPENTKPPLKMAYPAARWAENLGWKETIIRPKPFRNLSCLMNNHIHEHR